jgi:ATP/maltotriose-dependent transcriptional regulator MalT/DNA-binding SARP family transcriptional activator
VKRTTPSGFGNLTGLFISLTIFLAHVILLPMATADTILRTKLSPPKPPRTTLVRPRVDALLRDALDYRVTIVQASTGYGKSTALANLAEPLAESNVPLFWYSATEGDADPRQFVMHLIAAFRLGLPALSDSPSALLFDTDASALQISNVLLNALNDALNTPALLVIDDYHLAASQDVAALFDHFLSFLPADLHVIVASRYAPTWENLVSWRARGQVMEIKRDALAFTPDEIATLFRDTYNRPLSPRDVEILHEQTEGWSIALQLVWQELRAKPQATLADLLAHGTGDRVEGDHKGRPYHDILFAYLAHDVLAQQPSDVQNFLLQSATLRELTADACQAVTLHDDSRTMLNNLRERDLFVITLGENHYRYHHLFHDFLRNQATRENANAVRERHRLAAEFYQQNENFDEAIYHWLNAQAFADAATVIENIGERILREGRLDTLASWLDAIPPDYVAARPLLMFYLGELARLRSRFEDGLAWYAQAERAWMASNDVRGMARALRGQALIYLDTVRTRQAEELLQKALRLVDSVDDRASQARLLELLAENKLNMGKTEQAQELRERARTLREEGPGEDALSVRVKLRTGQLDKAREILETWAREERGKSHAPRSHRETLLLLSLVYAMQGRAEDSRRAAEEGITIGKQLASPFITAVALIRLGHAHRVCGDFRAAIQCYEESIVLGDKLMVQRIRAEAMWGMTHAHGFSGDLRAAQRDAAEAIEVTTNAGDAWLAALIQISLGSSLILAQRDREAVPVLSDALAGMRSCGDKISQVSTRIWLALAHWHLNQRDRAMTQLDEALTLAQSQHADYLFTTHTLLGMQDTRAIVPLLLEAKQRGMHVTLIMQLLATMGLEKNISTHPGYQLRVQTFGAFRVWRGSIEISAREWTRKKARQLLQLLVTQRGRLIEREEIFELLYRDTNADAASRDFKVALNALNKALEPERGDDEPAFIAREESAYGLRAGADVWIDANEFSQLVALADKATGDAALDLHRRALALYHDDYLIADARYDDWAVAERERLLALYLRAADHLASELLARDAFDESIAWCEKILLRDRCWEHAYRLMMRAYAQRGDRAQARRVYEQCVRALKEELDVEPSNATIEVYKASIQ